MLTLNITNKVIKIRSLSLVLWDFNIHRIGEEFNELLVVFRIE